MKKVFILAVFLFALTSCTQSEYKQWEKQCNKVKSCYIQLESKKVQIEDEAVLLEVMKTELSHLGDTIDEVKTEVDIRKDHFEAVEDFDEYYQVFDYVTDYYLEDDEELVGNFDRDLIVTNNTMYTVTSANPEEELTNMIRQRMDLILNELELYATPISSFQYKMTVEEVYENETIQYTYTGINESSYYSYTTTRHEAMSDILEDMILEELGYDVKLFTRLSFAYDYIDGAVIVDCEFKDDITLDTNTSYNEVMSQRHDEINTFLTDHGINIYVLNLFGDVVVEQLRTTTQYFGPSQFRRDIWSITLIDLGYVSSANFKTIVKDNYITNELPELITLRVFFNDNDTVDVRITLQDFKAEYPSYSALEDDINGMLSDINNELIDLNFTVNKVTCVYSIYVKNEQNHSEWITRETYLVNVTDDQSY